MAAKVKRAENLLTKLADVTGMTDAGKAWITASLDPFHDNPIDVKGYPDGVGSKGIVQVIKQSMTIQAPPNLVSTATWDCQIVQWPWVNDVQPTVASADITDNGTVNLGQAFVAGYCCQNGGSYNTTVGGLTAWTAPTGSDMSIKSVTNGASSVYGVSQLVLPSTYAVGKRRVIAEGFEVYNTSAQLYKGGSVITYRSPCEDVNTCGTPLQIIANTSAAFLTSYGIKTVICESPPANPAAALLLPYSRQWDAENGSYSVGMFNTTDVDAVADYAMQFFLTDHTGGGSRATYCAEPVSVQYTNLSGGATFYNPPSIQFNHMDMSGAYYTGLAPQSSLVINWNIYLERFPSNDDQDLVVLAKPAPERDDVALKFYSHASDQLPVGVPVKENGFGDWFKDVIGTASDYIAPVLSAIPHPAAQGIGMAIKGVNAVANADRVPQGLVPSNARVAPRQEAAQVAVKNRNVMVREKNAMIRAKNAEIRARKELKAAKKKK